MKKILSLVAVVLFSISAFGQAAPSATWGNRVVASLYNTFSGRLTATIANGSGVVLTIDNCYFVADGRKQFALSTSTPLTIGSGLTTAETLTPTAITVPADAPGSANGRTCTFTVTTSNTHYVGERVVFGDGGFYAAVRDIVAGIVVLDNQFSSDTAIGSLVGNYNVNLEDDRAGGPVTYSWNGTAYVKSMQPLSTANGAQLIPFYTEELITLATGSTNSDSVANLLPANAIILAVTGRVQTTITGSCTGWTLADGTTAGRFAASNTTLTAGTTSVGTVQATTGIASATTGMFQSAAAKVRIVCAGGNASAGKIRVSVFGYTVVPAAK